MVALRVSFALLLTSILSGTVSGMPFTKRIAQTISDSTQQWQSACLSAGGGQQCNPLSVTAFSTLLAAAGPCDQQNAGDQMIDLAKQLNNDADMIKFTQIFVQQARNTPSSQAVPYCQQAPKNAELNGLFQCQFQSADETTFVGGIAVGGPGTIPFGHTSPVSPPGSCAANPSGPIPDGQQLVSITQNPGLSNIGSSGNSTASATATDAATATATDAATATDSVTDSSSATATATAVTAASDTAVPTQTSSADSATDTCAPAATVTVTVTTSLDPSATPTATDSSTDSPTDTASASDVLSATATDSPATTSAFSVSSTLSVAPTATASADNSTASSSGFQLQNGLAAQALNAKFATLPANSTCNAGDQACISGGFSQCVGGQFLTTGCAATTACFALPLVNKPGTSVTCTTQADASARIAATGAQGGIDGSGN